MGYACPVCEDPQADAGHLANHLAFTALTSGGDHEEWLDEHVPDWGQLGEAELAERVVEHAPETEYPQVFEASGVEDGHEHGHDHVGHGHGENHADHDQNGPDISAARERGSGDVDADTRAILEEARELSPDGTASGDDDASDGEEATDETGEASESGEDETE